METKKEKLNVRDYITIAVLTVVEVAVYMVLGMPLGSTPITWVFCLGILAIPIGIIFMLMYTKVNKKGTVAISGILLALLVGMSFWVTGAIIATFAVIGEIIWRKSDRKKFKTMSICYTTLMLGWFLGAFLPLVLMKDMYLESLPTMADFYGQVFDLIAGPLFFVSMAVVIIGGMLGSLLGKSILKKHFQKAGVV